MLQNILTLLILCLFVVVIILGESLATGDARLCKIRGKWIICLLIILVLFSVIYELMYMQ